MAEIRSVSHFLSELALSEEAILRLNEFEYERTTPKSIPEDGSFAFVPAEHGLAPITSVTWNQNLLNVSVTTRIYGTVELGNEGIRLGLPRQYPTFTWRTYTVVLNGELYTPILPIVCNRSIIGLSIDSENRFSGKVDLSNLPMVSENDIPPLYHNRIFDLVYESAELHAIIKTLKHFRKQLLEGALEPTIVDRKSEYLRSVGVYPSGFRVPTETIEPKRTRIAKSARIWLKGISSLPSLASVIARMNNMEDMTPASRLIAFGIDYVRGHTGDILWIDDQIETLGHRKNYTDDTISKIKMYLALNGRWPFATFGETQTAHNGHIFIIKYEEKEISY